MLMQNLKMAEVVCAALADVEIAHLVYISSDAVYVDDANPVTEQSGIAPSTIHGMMHAARELMLKHSTKAPVAMLRPTLIYGAADPHNGYGPNRFRRQAAKGRGLLRFSVKAKSGVTMCWWMTWRKSRHWSWRIAAPVRSMWSPACLPRSTR